MATHHVDHVASSRTPSVTVLLANGGTVNSVAAALLDVLPVTTPEIALHVKMDSSAGQTMTAAGTSVHSDTIYLVIFALHVPLTIPSTSSTSSHLRTDVKSSSTTQSRTTSFASMEELKRQAEKSRSHLSSLIVEPGSTESTT